MLGDLVGMAGGPIIQMCWAVDDIGAAAHRWATTVGAGPFFLAPHIGFRDLTYRGQPATMDQSSAVGQWGTMQVELFQQHCDSPSPAAEMIADGHTGLQHVTWFAADIDAEGRRLRGLGFDELMTARLTAMGDMRVAWYDARPLLGCAVEIYEDTPMMRKFYARIAKAAVDWQGDEPLRPL